VSGIGVVAIGRNEGERLKRCLASLLGQLEDAARVVYVDSGSTDGSADMARALGVEVVDLDTSVPFTAARARNAGFERLTQRHGDAIELVQFVDGDCEVDPAWLGNAEAALRGDEQLAAVCGRRRERRPEATVWNRLCDMEWDTPVGRAEACGGDAMYRAAAFTAIGGFNGTLIAGEEPELCYRLRASGRVIARLDAEMTLHDADMTRFGQWWKRAVRAGHAYAENAAMHGGGLLGRGHRVKQTRSIVLWGGVMPVVAALAAVAAAVWPWAALVPAVVGLGYLALLAKVTRYRLRHGDPLRLAAVYALFAVIGKLPNLVGVIKYWRTRRSGKRATLIEYKTAAAS